jgi:hypothetical protein
MFPSRGCLRHGPPLAAAGVVAGVVTILAGLLAAAPATAEARAIRHGSAHPAKTKAKPAAAPARKRAAPRSKIVPDQEGKIVVFPIKDDDDHAIAAQIERLLKTKGLEVVTGVRRVDTAEQYREMAGALGLVAYVDGSLKEGQSSSRVTLQVRSGYTGQRMALTTFKETKLHLRAEIEDKLWTKVGPAIARACTDAAKPRKRGRGPLLIEAGTPLADPGQAPAGKPASAPAAESDVDPGV